MDIRMSNIASPMPQIRAKFTNKLGIPLSGCKVYTYEPNSDIPKTTWLDIDKTTENTNPILLDAAGEADIFLDGLYRIVVKDRFGFVVYDVEKTGTHTEWDASFVVDASGKTQQEINNIKLNAVNNYSDLPGNSKNGDTYFVSELTSSFIYKDGSWIIQDSSIVNLKNYPRLAPEIDDSGRFLRASEAVRVFVIPSSPSGYLVASATEVIIPAGYYSISQEVEWSGLVKIKSDGQAIIQQTNPNMISFKFTQTSNDFDKFSTYRNIVEGVKFVGGKHSLFFSNENKDATTYKAINCEFHSTTDYAISMNGTWKPNDDHLSAIVEIQSCKFVASNGFIYNKADKCTLRDCWLYVNKNNFRANRATIVNQSGVLIVDDCLGVPVVGEGNPDTAGATRLKYVRWVDNYGSVILKDSRFGLESQGMPIVYSFGGEWQNDRMTSFNMPGVAASNETQMGSSIIIENCYASGGLGYNIEDAGLIVLKKYLPQQIIIKGNDHILSCPIIRVHPDYVDFKSYFNNLYVDNNPKLLEKYNYQIEVNQTWEANNYPSDFPPELSMLINRGKIDGSLTVPKLTSKVLSDDVNKDSVFKYSIPRNIDSMVFLATISGNFLAGGSQRYRDCVTKIIVIRTSYDNSLNKVVKYLTEQVIGDFSRPESIGIEKISASVFFDNGSKMIDAQQNTEIVFFVKGSSQPQGEQYTQVQLSPLGMF